jgi:two-component system, OmpR family, phosphate regulon sensor histidine kinase PhoR
MNKSSPRNQAILISTIAAILSCFIFFLAFNIARENIILVTIISGLVVFVVVYSMIYFFLRNFIQKKLTPIYKTLDNLRHSEKQGKKLLHFKHQDIIKQVQDDVMVFAKDKTHEIAQLKELEKYRREFLGNVSHELKTPIFNIQGYISTLIDGGLEDESINKLYLEKADKSVNRLISIVNDLESISRLESGELKLELKKINIVRLVEDVFEDHEILAKDRKITLKFTREINKPFFVMVDKKRMLEVLNNLIINSIKYGHQNGTTAVDIVDMGEHIRVDIADDGVGISDKDLPRIFERFYRTDKSRSRDMGGTGLGLSIVKHIIEAHNQQIIVKTALNKGSTFSFTLAKAEE